MKNTFKLIILILIISVYASCVKNTDGSVTVVPLAPTNLTASAISSVKVSLQWTDNATNETGYKIERKIATGNYAVVGTVLADITNFKDSSLSPNTTYTYRVYPYNAAGNSITYSNEVTVTTSQIVPNAPLTLTALVTSTNKVNLQWADNSLNESGFKIERKIVGGTYSLIGTTNANIINFTDSSVGSNTNYTYRVFAYNGVGNSGYSNEVTITSKTASWTTICYNDSIDVDLIVYNSSNIYTLKVIYSYSLNKRQIQIGKWNGASWVYSNINTSCDTCGPRKLRMDQWGNIVILRYTGTIEQWNGTNWSIPSDVGDFESSKGIIYLEKLDGLYKLNSNSSQYKIANSIQIPYSISNIFIDGLNNIYVGYQNTIYKWDANGLHLLGGNLYTQNQFYGNYDCLPSASDPAGNLYAYIPNYNNGISPLSGHIGIWNGTNWSELGGTNFSTFTYPCDIKIISDDAGNIYGTSKCFKNSLNGKNCVAQWNGTSWSELGGTNVSTFPNPIEYFTTDSAGNIYVVTTNNSGRRYVAKYGY